MTDWPFGDVRPLSFGCAMIDFPWRYETWSDKGKGRAPDRYYDTMTLDEGKALPVDQLLVTGAGVMMWAVAPMLPQCIDLLAAWNLTYCTAGVWVKTKKDGTGRPMGTGWRLRGNAEIWIIATTGSPPQLVRDQVNVIESPRRRHSEKPDEAYTICERLFRGPYIELFSRKDRPGWKSWGDEKGKLND